MSKILIVECMQEISSFNPLPSGYENFDIQRGDAVYEQRGRNQAIGGALSVLEHAQGVDVVPAISARAGSAGLLSAAGWKRLSAEIMDHVRARIDLPIECDQERIVKLECPEVATSFQRKSFTDRWT